MNALGYFIVAIAKMIHLIINIYTFVVAIAVILSWIRPDPYNPIVRIIYQVTEPVFFQIRRLLPRSFFRTGFDVTPLIAVLVLILIDTVIVNLLFDLGRSFFQ